MSAAGCETDVGVRGRRKGLEDKTEPYRAAVGRKGAFDGAAVEVSFADLIVVATDAAGVTTVVAGVTIAVAGVACPVGVSFLSLAVFSGNYRTSP